MADTLKSVDRPAVHGMVVVNPDGSSVGAISSLTPSEYDYISVTYPSATQEVYVFKNGGSGGTTVSTVTLNYTDSTKESLSNAAKT